MVLESIEIINGFLGIIYVIVSLVIGIRLMTKYFQNKNTIFIYVGLTWIGLSTLWLAASISFILALTTGDWLPPIPYFLIGVSLIPFFLFMWMIAFSSLVFEYYKNIFLGVFAIFCMIIEVIFFYLLFTDHSMIGIQNTPIDTDWGIFMTIYLILVIIIALITGGLFSYKSIISENPEIRLRGKVILISFIIWALGSIIDTIFEFPLMRTLAIILLIVASFLWYFAFNLPKFLKKRFSK